MIGRDHAERLDAGDELAPFRNEFVVADDRIYLDGNSLGRLPRRTVEAMRDVVERQWGKDLVGGWHHWIDLAREVGDALGRDVLGARPGEVVVADSTTVNFYKLAAAALDARPGRSTIVTDEGNFPTDRYVLQGLAAERGARLVEVRADPAPADVAAALRHHDVALVTLSHVSFTTGALLDMAGITAAAHDAGALVLWDLSHSAGAVPLDLHACGVDLAVGCTYKYLNGGPGAPAFLYVRADLQERLRQPIWGWFGAREQFEMRAEYEPAPGIDRFLSGTPPVLALTAVREGVGLTARAGLPALRAKSERLVQLLVDLAGARLAPLGFEVRTPAEPDRRGSHVALAHTDGWRIAAALIQRQRVVPDFRPPDVIRLGLAPLYTRFVDVWDAVERIAEVVERGMHEAMPAGRSRVT